MLLQGHVARRHQPAGIFSVSSKFPERPLVR